MVKFVLVLKKCYICLYKQKTNTIIRQVILYPGEDHYWVSECPSLPGCISQGKTKEEALTNIKEAIHAYIAALEEDGISVPKEKFETVLLAV